MRQRTPVSTWQVPLQAGRVTRLARLSAPDDPLGWVVIGRTGGGDPPPVLSTIVDELHRAGLGTMSVPVFGRDQARVAGWVHVAADRLRADVGGGPPIAYLGAGRRASAGWIASLGGELSGVMAWNGRFRPAWGHLPYVAVPSLLAVDADAGRWHVLVGHAARWRLGAGADLARLGAVPDAALLVEWYDRRLLGRAARAVPAPEPRRAALRRVASVTAVAALAAIPAGLPKTAAAMPDFSGGKVLNAVDIAGDHAFSAAGIGGDHAPAAAAAGAQPDKPGDGKRLHPGAIAGDPPLTDGIGLRWDINTNVGFATTSSASGAASEANFTHAVAASTLNGGTVNALLVDAFDGYNALCLDVNNVGGQCNTANMAVYNQNGPASLECSGRQVVLPQRTIGAFNVRRKVFVPSNDGFARWLNIVTNTSGSTQTVRLQTSNNLGSDAGTRIVTTSDGDAVPELTDTWVTTFQNFSGTTSSDPRLGHVFQGPGAPVQVSALSFVDGDDNPFWRYTFNLAPGQTAIIMNFATGQATKAAAAAKAAQLASLSDPNALACMTDAEKHQVRNFHIGSGPLPGVVTGSTSWSLRDSLTSGGPTIGPFSYGTRPLVPIMGDWDGDGVKTPGTYEAGVFKLRNSNSAGAPDLLVTFGDPRGFAVAGDFDGDGKDDVGTFRDGTWNIRFTATGATVTFVFGSGTWPGTVPVVGDWDGNGVDGIGTYSAGTWNLRQTASAGAADAGSFVYAPGTSPYPVVGDWDHNGTDTVGVKAGTDWLLRNSNSAGAPDLTITYGLANDLPVVWQD